MGNPSISCHSDLAAPSNKAVFGTVLVHGRLSVGAALEQMLIGVAYRPSAGGTFAHRKRRLSQNSLG